MRVVVVEDSNIFRKVVRDTLAELPGVEVVGVAADGDSALAKIGQLKPDLVTLDVEMPQKSGLDVLTELRGRPQRPEVIMVSSLTDSTARATTAALRLGAFDFVLKPSAASIDENRQALHEHLVPKVHAVMERLAGEKPAPLAAMAASPAHPQLADLQKSADDFDARASLIAIGVSTGGPSALAELLPRLPAELPVPILIVQHMPAVFTKSLAEDLNKTSRIAVCEARHRQPVEPGHAYIAPGGQQMKIGSAGGRAMIQITNDPPEKNCRPSVDYLFRSVAHCYGKDALAVIMTGMGDDGTLGCRLLKRTGASVVVQDEASCVVYGMPRQVADAGLADLIVPLGQLHEVLQRAAAPGVGACR